MPRRDISWIIWRTPVPAFRKITSSPPKRLIAVATISSQTAFCETSPSRNRASPPSDSMSLSMRGSPRSAMSTQTTLAPSRANSRAVALPMPLSAAVTTATCPVSRPLPAPIRECSPSCVVVISPSSRNGISGV